MTTRLNSGIFSSFSPAKVLARAYPLSISTPIALARQTAAGTITRPDAGSSFVERMLQRRFTNSRSDQLLEFLVCRNCMLPGIRDGDRVLLEERQYFGGVLDPDYPKRSDIVAFWNPRTGECMVKRLMALPGDTMAIKSGRVILNGSILLEPYGPIGRMADMDEIRIPKRHVFVLADNRSKNEDSRSLGPIRISLISGIVRQIIQA